MRRERIMLLPLLLSLLIGLGACSPGHVGTDKIAFVRGGHLWTVYPDGSNVYQIVGDLPVVGYSWSPSHEVLAFRQLDGTFAKTAAARNIASNPITGAMGDLPSSLNTVGIDGGMPIPSLFSSAFTRYSNAWWNPAGNRLLYRTSVATSTPSGVQWGTIQNDQPGGIASKVLPGSYAIPSLAYNSLEAIGNSTGGIFTTTLAGTNVQYIVRGELPGHPLPATLERILWQPAHQGPAILYAIPTSPAQIHQFGTTSIQVQLILRTTNGQSRTLATCACTQFAWSPDGNHVLYSTDSTYTILNLDGSAPRTVSAEAGSVPYWSPDSRFLLFDGLHTLTLAQIATGQQQILLKDTSAEAGQSTQLDVNALLQPALNSPWAADSRRFLFLTRGRSQWQGQALQPGRGIYIASIDDQGQSQGSPTVIDTGADSQAGWTYEDANTSFLF